MRCPECGATWPTRPTTAAVATCPVCAYEEATAGGSLQGVEAENEDLLNGRTGDRDS